MKLKEAVEAALASIRMEGIELPPSALEHFEDIKSGKITTQQARAFQYLIIDMWKEEHPEWFCQGKPIPDKNDRYCYAGTRILINKFNIIDPELLSIVEGYFSAVALIELSMSS